jgi:hypothetical protein
MFKPFLGQKFCPFSKNVKLIPSHLGSSLVDQLHAQGAPTTVLNTSTLNGENYNYVSPNSILSRNEDSGLETV